MHKLDTKRILNAFEMKYYRTILLYNFVKRQQLKIIWPRYSPQWFRENNNARNGSRKKKQRKAKTKIGERQITDTFGTMAAAASRVAAGINFAETSRQRRSDEDMLREESDQCKLLGFRTTGEPLWTVYQYGSFHKIYKLLIKQES